MKVSVVIPTLNEEKDISKALFHITRLKPYEVIVVDGYSKDKTRQMAKKFKAKVLLKRGNVSVARNRGAQKAKGDIVLFLDADTIVYDNIIDIIKRDFSRSKNLVGWTCNVYGFSPYWSEQRIYYWNNVLTKFLINKVKKPHAPGIAIAVRKKTFEKIGRFNEKMRVMEDHDMALRIAKHGSFKFSKDTCVFTSTRRINRWGRLQFIKKYSKKYFSYMLKKKQEFDKEKDYEVIR